MCQISGGLQLMNVRGSWYRGCEVLDSYAAGWGLITAAALAWWMRPPAIGRRTSSHRSRPVCPLSTAHFHNMSRVFVPAPSNPRQAPGSAGGQRCPATTGLYSTSCSWLRWDCISSQINPVCHPKPALAVSWDGENHGNAMNQVLSLSINASFPQM